MIRLPIFIFLLYSGVAVFITYMPLYYQQQGLSKTEIGIVLGVSALVSVAAQPVWGIVSDKWNTVKKLILLLLGATLVISFILFQMNSFALLLAAICLFSLFNSAIPALTDSLSVMVAHNHGRGFGFFRLFGDLGVGTSSLLLGFLITLLGMHNLGWMYAGIIIICMFAAMALPEAQIRPVPISSSSLVGLFTNKGFLWFMFIVLLLAVPHRMNDGLLGIFISSMNGTDKQVGQAWMIATFSSIPLFACMSLLLRKFHPLLLLSISGILYTGRWWMHSVIYDADWLVMLQVVQGITFPLFFVSAVSYVSQIVPSELRSTGQTTLAAVFGGIAGIIGSSAGGWIMDHLSPQYAYQIGGLISLIGTAAVLLTWLRIRQMPKQQTAQAAVV